MLKKKHMTYLFAWMMVLFLLQGGVLSAGETPLQPVIVGQQMPDFTLEKYQGGSLAFSALKGKNVMLIFPRGLAGKNHWCHVCNYRYADLVELEKTKNIREQYNLEIVYVLPYGKDLLAEWFEKFPDQLADIESWKNPKNPEKLDDKGKRRMLGARKFFPHVYTYENGKVPTPFPILMDNERIVSKGLGLFAEEWSGSEIDQNVPTVFLIDKSGIVQFKYFSQNTLDRPGFPYLLKFLDLMMEK